MKVSYKSINKKMIYFKLIIALVLTTILSATACSTNTKKQSTAENPFDIKSATIVADKYMNDLMKNDMENAKKTYSKKLLKKSVNIQNPNLLIKGYKIDEVSELGSEGIFNIKVTRSDLKQPYAALDQYKITIIKEGIDYKIDEIENSPEKEALFEDGGIRLKSKTNVKSNLIIDDAGLPVYAFSKDDNSNVEKVSVPRSNYGILAFSYMGDSIAISTFDKNSYAGIVKIDESIETQGSSDSNGGKKANGGSNTPVREAPIGKEIVSLDIIKDSNIEFMTFSPDEKFVVIQYNKTDIGKCLRMYKTSSGELISYKFEEKFPINYIEITFSSFDKDVMNFAVSAKPNAPETAYEYVGKWQLSLKDFKAKKI
jgi:hypothetical protein